MKKIIDTLRKALFPVRSYDANDNEAAKHHDASPDVTAKELHQEIDLVRKHLDNISESVDCSIPH